MTQEDVRAETLMTIISDGYRYLLSCEATMAEIDGKGKGEEGVIDGTRGLQHILEERLRDLKERLYRLDERMMDFKNAIDS